MFEFSLMYLLGNMKSNMIYYLITLDDHLNIIEALYIFEQVKTCSLKNKQIYQPRSVSGATLIERFGEISY